MAPKSKKKQVSEMSLYENEGTRRRQFGSSLTYINDKANKLHESTTANVAFVAIEENGRQVSADAPQGSLVQTLSRRGYVPMEPMARVEVAANDLEVNELDDAGSLDFEVYVRTTLLQITEEQAKRT